MIVLDEEPYRWLLLDEDGRLYLDVSCSHSAVDYLFLMALTGEEAALFRERGRGYLDDLSAGIQWSAPGVRGSRSPYKARSLVMTPERERANDAIREWSAAQPPA